MALSSTPTTHRSYSQMTGQTDGQTPDHYTDPAAHTKLAVPITPKRG